MPSIFRIAKLIHDELSKLALLEIPGTRQLMLSGLGEDYKCYTGLCENQHGETLLYIFNIQAYKDWKLEAFTAHQTVCGEKFPQASENSSK